MPDNNSENAHTLHLIRHDCPLPLEPTLPRTVDHMVVSLW